MRPDLPKLLGTFQGALMGDPEGMRDGGQGALGDPDEQTLRRHEPGANKPVRGGRRERAPGPPSQSLARSGWSPALQTKSTLGASLGSAS